MQLQLSLDALRNSKGDYTWEENSSDPSIGHGSGSSSSSSSRRGGGRERAMGVLYLNYHAEADDEGTFLFLEDVSEIVSTLDCCIFALRSYLLYGYICIYLTLCTHALL